jgi:TonB family protein
MEAFALYLLKSVVWLSGFALIFILFLRNERFFVLNRIYLISGILTSFLLPFVSIHYTVILPAVKNIQTEEVKVLTGIQNAVYANTSDIGPFLPGLYIAGVFVVILMIVRQNKSIIKAIRKAEIINSHSVKLIRTSEYPSSFSFFSYVFVNPSITDIETEEIVNHEMVHIRQWHWFDLVLVELLCMLQWFNPLVWIYIRFLRQNHEYLADEVALQRTSDPAIYRAALLNQIVGYPVVSLTNSFNYSLNSKRFKMMKNIINSPYRKMKLLFILPVIAIVLYSFAKPDYKYVSINGNSGVKDTSETAFTKEVKGTVVQQLNGSPLEGALVIVMGTTLGSSTDAKGFFRIENLQDDAELVVSFVGFKSKVIKPVFTSDMIIKMVQDTVKYLDANISTPPPPPPPSPVNNVEDINAPTPLPKMDNHDNEDVTPPAPPLPEDPPRVLIRGNGPPPLYVIDGIITENININTIDPESIDSIRVTKDAVAIEKYGEKGKDGVVEIYTKKNDSSRNDKLRKEVKSTGNANEQKAEKTSFTVVEELPEFPGGGKPAMAAWINNNLKYPGDAVKGKITGKVFVNFMVSSTGEIKNVQVDKSVNPLLDAEAKRVVSSMPDWKPGSQRGKPIDVQMMVPVEFKLQ